MSPLDDPLTSEVIILKLVNQQLPEAQSIQNKMAKGQQLNDFDLQHLQHMLHYTHEILPHIKHHKEYGPLANSIIALYHQIIEEALNAELALKHDTNVQISAKLTQGEILKPGND